MTRAAPVSVLLSKIVVSPDLQVRARTDPATVRRYAQAMAAAATFPPLELAELDGALLLVDGFHRLEAMRSRGERQTTANVRQAGSLEEARWWAAQANLAHGLPLKAAERREVFRAYVSAFRHRQGERRRGDLKSYREMAEELHFPHSTLRNWMRQDFPSVYRALQEGQGEAPGGLPEAEPAHRAFMRQASVGLEAALAAVPGVSDPQDRGRLLEQVEDLRSALLAAGTEPEAPF